MHVTNNWTNRSAKCFFKTGPTNYLIASQGKRVEPAIHFSGKTIPCSLPSHDRHGWRHLLTSDCCYQDGAAARIWWRQQVFYTIKMTFLVRCDVFRTSVRLRMPFSHTVITPKIPQTAEMARSLLSRHWDEMRWDGWLSGVTASGHREANDS